MRKHSKVFFLSAVFLFPPLLFAAHEITISPAQVKVQLRDRYTVAAVVRNTTEKPRELTLRAQLIFFDEISADGDKPVAILRKDETLVLKAGENRKVRIRLIDEGTVPKGRMRLVPEIRLRRQRIWNY